jgi:hypothetical protein
MSMQIIPLVWMTCVHSSLGKKPYSAICPSVWRIHSGTFRYMMTTTDKYQVADLDVHLFEEEDFTINGIYSHTSPSRSWFFYGAWVPHRESGTYMTDVKTIEPQEKKSLKD